MQNNQVESVAQAAGAVIPLQTGMRMPAIFFGHGSPMNALEENDFTRAWAALGRTVPTPCAILVVSAHWLTNGTAVTAMAAPPTIHDFGNFPQALFDMQYPAPGDPALAARIADLLAPTPVAQDTAWGLDHGTWSVLTHVYPDANVPVLQLSIDMRLTPEAHFALGRQLSTLRDEGVLLIATGNVVHNLRSMRFDGSPPHPWAQRFHDCIRNAIVARDFDSVVHFARLGEDARLSVPSDEHFLPLLYILGAAHADDPVRALTDAVTGAAISMLTVAVGNLGPMS